MPRFWRRREFPPNQKDAARRFAAEQPLGHMVKDDGFTVQFLGAPEGSCPRDGTALALTDLGDGTARISGGCGCYRAWSPAGLLSLIGNVLVWPLTVGVPVYVEDCDGARVTGVTPTPEEEPEEPPPEPGVDDPDASFICNGADPEFSGVLMGHWPLISDLASIAGPLGPMVSYGGPYTHASHAGKTGVRANWPDTPAFICASGITVDTYGFTTCYWAYGGYNLERGVSGSYEVEGFYASAFASSGLRANYAGLGSAYDSGPIALGWHHIALVSDRRPGAPYSKVYLDGVLVHTDTVSLGAACSTYHFQGKLDQGTAGALNVPEQLPYARHYRLYSKALTQAQVQAIMAADA